MKITKIYLTTGKIHFVVAVEMNTYTMQWHLTTSFHSYERDFIPNNKRMVMFEWQPKPLKNHLKQLIYVCIYLLLLLLLLLVSLFSPFSLSFYRSLFVCFLLNFILAALSSIEFRQTKDSRTFRYLWINNNE